jgi:hypothetical protein
MLKEDFTLFGVSASNDSEVEEMKDILRSPAMRDFVEKLVIPAHSQCAHDAMVIRDEKMRLVEAGRYEILSELIAIHKDI